jgi:hypothetical protein
MLSSPGGPPTDDTSNACGECMVGLELHWGVGNTVASPYPSLSESRVGGLRPPFVTKRRSEVAAGIGGFSPADAVMVLWQAAGESRDALAEERVFNQFPLQPGFRESSSGLQFLDVRLGEGAPAKVGGKVVCDWAGYTIHLGRIIESKNLTKGGAFSGEDNELLRCDCFQSISLGC